VAGTTFPKQRLLLGILVLDSGDTLSLLGNASSTTFAGSLRSELRLESTKKSTLIHTLFLTRRASIWSERILVRFFSAFALWIYSMRTRLFLKTLPFDFWYREW
jgi:hypothetical protein